MTRAGAFNVKNPSLAERAGVSLRQKQTKPRICQDARVFISRASKGDARHFKNVFVLV